MKRDKVLVTGANGNLAKKVITKLSNKGYDVITFSTDKNNIQENNYYWNIEEDIIDEKSLANCKHIIHLSGYSILKPWTKKNKKKIYNSRISTAEILLNSCKKNNTKIETFISASAIGIYGTKNEKEYLEGDEGTNEWISRLATDWENSAYNFKDIKSRVICMRISLLIDKNSGILHTMKRGMKFGIWVLFGDRSNIIEWIHIDDAVNFILFCLENKDIKGSYNLATEKKVSQQEFAKFIRKKHGKHAFLLSFPKFITKLFLGSRSTILEFGTRVSVEKLKNIGFKWKYPSLSHIYKENR